MPAHARVDYAALDCYLRLRLAPLRRAASVAAKTLLPTAAFARRTVVATPADIVLLHPHLPGQRRHARIVASLERRGFVVREEIVPGARELLRGRKLAAPAGGWRDAPRRWRPQAGYAAWIVARYRPKLVVTFMDDTVHTPFLHEALAAAGAPLVNMSHTICFPMIDFSMCDVDWLILFGERSLANLEAMPVRYGKCRAIVAGSPYLVGDMTATAPATAPRDPPRLLWLAQYAPAGQRESMRRDLAALARFIEAHPRYELTVRLHPLDAGETRAILEPMLPAARWQVPERLLSEVIGDFDIVLSSFSAGLIDAAAYGKPPIALTTNPLAAALGLQDVGLPVVSDHAGLENAVEAILRDYPAASAAALALAREHYHELSDATERIAELLSTIARGGDVAALGLPMRELDARMPEECR